MLFLATEDFNQVASPEEIDSLSDNDELSLDKAEISSISFFKGYLRSRYDIDAEFEKTEDDRDATLVVMLCDWVIWTLQANEPERFVSDIRIQRKDDVEAWLKGCQKGTINPGFAPLVDESGKDISTGMKYGGNERVSSAW